MTTKNKTAAFDTESNSTDKTMRLTEKNIRKALGGTVEVKTKPAQTMQYSPATSGIRAGALIPSQPVQPKAVQPSIMQSAQVVKPNAPAINAGGEIDLAAELTRLRAENERLKKGSSGGLSCKVSEKGALSIYGFGRFPVTLYKSQFLKLKANWEQVCAFYDAHESEFVEKPTKE